MMAYVGFNFLDIFYFACPSDANSEIKSYISSASAYRTGYFNGRPNNHIVSEATPHNLSESCCSMWCQ